MELQTQLEVQSAVQQWIVSFMNNNNIDASIMLAALNNINLQLKDQIMMNLLIELQNQEQEKKEKKASTQEVKVNDSSDQ